MHKSSVYLPQELKGRLSAMAARTGRAEAELIRAAVVNLVSGGATAAPERRPSYVPLRPSVHVVRVGPGDPDLLTMRASETLRAADQVFVLTTDARSIGRAEMVVRAAAPAARVIRVPYAIGPDEDVRRRSLGAVVGQVLAGVDTGEVVAVAILGDPAQWTVHASLADALAAERPQLPVIAVPGVSAYQSAAADAGLTLGAPGEPLVVVDNVVDLDAFLGRRDATVVLFKATTDAETLQHLANAHERSGVLTELTGLPGERTVPLDDLPPGPLSYLATAVFPSRSHQPATAR